MAGRIQPVNAKATEDRGGGVVSAAKKWRSLLHGVPPGSPPFWAVLPRSTWTTMPAALTTSAVWFRSVGGRSLSLERTPGLRVRRPNSVDRARPGEPARASLASPASSWLCARASWSCVAGGCRGRVPLCGGCCRGTVRRRDAKKTEIHVNTTKRLRRRSATSGCFVYIECAPPIPCAVFEQVTQMRPSPSNTTTMVLRTGDFPCRTGNNESSLSMSIAPIVGVRSRPPTPQ